MGAGGLGGGGAGRDTSPGMKAPGEAGAAGRSGPANGRETPSSDRSLMPFTSRLPVVALNINDFADSSRFGVFRGDAEGSQARGTSDNPHEPFPC